MNSFLYLSTQLPIILQCLNALIQLTDWVHTLTPKQWRQLILLLLLIILFILWFGTGGQLTSCPDVSELASIWLTGGPEPCPIGNGGCAS